MKTDAALHRTDTMKNERKVMEMDREFWFWVVLILLAFCLGITVAHAGTYLASIRPEMVKLP